MRPPRHGRGVVSVLANLFRKRYPATFYASDFKHHPRLGRLGTGSPTGPAAAVGACSGHWQRQQTQAATQTTMPIMLTTQLPVYIGRLRQLTHCQPQEAERSLWCGRAAPRSLTGWHYTRARVRKVSETQGNALHMHLHIIWLDTILAQKLADTGQHLPSTLPGCAQHRLPSE